MQEGAPKRTHILVFGITDDQWDFWRPAIKSGLQGRDMAWSFTGNSANNLEDLRLQIARREDLQVVFMLNENERNKEQMREAATAIAEAIILHPGRPHPWVGLDLSLYYLEPIFEQCKIEVIYGYFEQIIFERWAHLDMEARRKAA